ncbi:MAG: trypsin-like peptidase domain-containing protein [Planctomycetes bacterium]|nr:trypsin-like peptidase domain-containing protein [Planctomycetota bacterium]
MKRTLLEILSGLAVLVVLASFHKQISRLNNRQDEVAKLQTLVRDAVADASAKRADETARSRALADLRSKLHDLEQKLAQASYSSSETKALREALAQTRKQAELLGEQLKLDISRTRATVDAVHDEMRTYRTSETKSLEQTRADLALLARHVHRDPQTLTKELLGPAVQLNGDDTVGSGTVIHSGPTPASNKTETYIITSYHVVRNILADTPRAKKEGLAITIYGDEGKIEAKGDMVLHNPTIDAALIKVRGNQKVSKVARIMSEADARSVQVWDPVFAVGCPLGNDPIPTQGEVSSLRNNLNGANYWMINAPTYFGNSGGGVFHAESRELIGVFSKIYTHGRGNPVVIPHMGLFTPMPAIHEWLKKANMGFVLDNSTAPRRESPIRLEHLLAPAPR